MLAEVRKPEDGDVDDPVVMAPARELLEDSTGDEEVSPVVLGGP